METIGVDLNDGLPSISVVIPTYQRAKLVQSCVYSVAKNHYNGQVEIIVVVDGSTDETVETLRALKLSKPLQIVEQKNKGAASARNAGAQVATGKILLFVDDDMQADVSLLTEHAKFHCDGAQAVLGHIPLHPDSPPTLVSKGVGEWANRRRDRLAKPKSHLTLYDLLSGQLSVRRDIFQDLGGFDTDFTAGGGYGDEDLDFCCRLIDCGAKIAFNPAAISWQRYDVLPKVYFRQWHQAGMADVTFARKHPKRAAELFFLHHIHHPVTRFLWRPLAAVPFLGAWTSQLVKAAALILSAHFPRRRFSRAIFYGARNLHYWMGVRKAGGVPRPRPVLVLSYHAICDLRGDQLLESYAVPPEEFKSQMKMLLRLGFNFISSAELLGYLKCGSGLPPRPVLLTFDDCYEDLLHTVKPMLRERNIPGLAFAVSSLVGGFNEWDRKHGASSLRLLSADDLREIVRAGIEIGSHTKTHQDLTKLSQALREDEIAGSADELESIELPRPRFIAYPYGEHSAVVRKTVRESGFVLGFALGAGRVNNRSDMFALPRTEIRRGDVGTRFLWKLLRAPGS